MPTDASNPNSAALKRKRSAILNKLRPSEGFLAAAKSRDSVPDAFRDELDLDAPRASRSGMSLGTSRASGSGSIGARSSTAATPTRPKPKPIAPTTTTPKKQGIIFVTSEDPGLSRSRSRQKVKSPLKVERSAKGKGKEKEIDEENDRGDMVDTPTRPRARDLTQYRERSGSSMSPEKSGRSRGLESEGQSGSDDDDRGDAEPLDEGDSVRAEESGDGEGSDEDIASDWRKGGRKSPNKRSQSGSPRKKKAPPPPPPPSLLHVPGFVMQTPSDVYFQQMSIPARASHKLFSTHVPTLSLDEYLAALEQDPTASKHEAELKKLEQSHVECFDRWIMELRAGFNLLLYGFGSKRNILNRFAREACSAVGDVVVLNAYRTGVGFKELLSKIEALVGSDHLPSGAEEDATITGIDLQAHRIYRYYSPLFPSSPRSTRPPLFIVIHNIDSPTLRSTKAKNILALLVSNPKIHLVGSVDHINAPLIWTDTEASGRGHDYFAREDEETDATASSSIPPERNFTWLWHDLTTYGHYDIELLSQRNRDLTSVKPVAPSKAKSGAAVPRDSGPLTEAGAQQVLSSVTERSRKVFTLLANKQLENIDAEPLPADGGEGKRVINATAAQMHQFAIPYESLFGSARESFIATSDQALRGLLQEFRDHGMVATGVPGGGGAEMIWIPLARNVLDRLVESLNDNS